MVYNILFHKLRIIGMISFSESQEVYTLALYV